VAPLFIAKRTFDRKQAAAAWLERRERALAAPGALERRGIADPPLADVIDRYVAESKKEIGRTKAQVLPRQPHSGSFELSFA